MESLKNCPFCGSDELSEWDPDDWMADGCVRCDNCGALGPTHWSWGGAKIEWNKRAGDK